MQTMDGKRAGADQTDPDSKRPKPANSSLASLRSEYEKSTPWRGNVDAKLNSAAPYGLFLTRIKDISSTYDEDLSITFLELIDQSLGEIEHIVHFNYMVEVGWLLAQYAVVGIPNPPMTVFYGVEDPELESLPPSIKLKPVRIRCSDPFGHHHTKMMLHFYKDGSARIIICTANLTESDWENRTQGVWVSPRLPGLAEDAADNVGESVTLFRKDLLQYLNFYKKPDLEPWIKRLKNTDMSSIMVCFIASVPGTHLDNSYGYRKLRSLIQEHVTSPNAHTWTLVAQCSSIGSLGPNYNTWLCGPFGRALQEKPFKDVCIKVVYPTLANVKGSVDGMLGGACLPYSSQTHNRQLWLKDQLWQWKSDDRCRTKAVPHIKTYTKLSPSGKSAAWFVLTSANLSKAAWGGPVTDGIHIRSYEVGVVFLPKFLTGETEFRVKTKGSFEKNEDLPLPFDTPLTPYSSTDKRLLSWEAKDLLWTRST